MGVGRTRAGHRLCWRLTPAGWLLAVAFVVLAVLAVVDPSGGVYAGLIAVVVLWAVILSAGSPTGSARGMHRGVVGRTDFGREAARDYERQHGYRR
jgi:hypothetical protein